jgi:hypothetical protein
MNKDLHHIDELFRSELDDYKVTPSAGAKENIDAALDKQDAEKYKKRFIIWKRAAFFLLLLLAGFVLYESGFIKTGRVNYTEKNASDDKKDVSTGKNEKNNQNKNNSFSSNTETVAGENIVTQKNNSEYLQSQLQITGIPGNSVFSGDKAAGPGNNQLHNLLFPFTQKQYLLFSNTLSQQDKKMNPFFNDDVLQTNKQNVGSSDEKLGIAKAAGDLFKKILLLPPVTVSYSPLFSIKNDTTAKKNNNPFKPFWMINPFASYEQIGYRLDSDDPLTATVIRHREVHEPSFSAGILATRQFTSRWGLQSGLVYTNTQIGISPQKMYALQLPGGDVAYKFITSSGYAYIKLGTGQPPAVGDSITTSDAKHLLKHISVPISVKYKVGKNRFTLSPSAGIEANFISSAKVEVGVDLASNREIVSVNKLNGIKPFYWSAVTGVEASYQVNKKLSVTVQPVFRHALSPITKDNVVETFPRSFGIRAGVTIKFK